MIQEIDADLIDYCYDLQKSKYREAGLEVPVSSAEKIAVFGDVQPVSTVSLLLSRQANLSIDREFPAEMRELRERYEVQVGLNYVGEIARLAGSEVTGRKIKMYLDLIEEKAKKIGVKLLVLATHPDHVRLYERGPFGFTRFGKPKLHSCGGLCIGCYKVLA